MSHPRKRSRFSSVDTNQDEDKNGEVSDVKEQGDDDNEDEMEVDALEAADGIEDMTEEDLDDELALPDELKDADLETKREMYSFQQSHTEMEWEDELLRRVEEGRQMRDLERLQKMTGGQDKGAESGKGKKSAKKSSKKRRAEEEEVDSDDAGDDDEEDDEDDEEEGGDEVDDDDESDDDLFDSDEELEISNRGKESKTLGEGRTGSKSKKEKLEVAAEKKLVRAKKAAAAAEAAGGGKKRRGLKDLDSEDEEEYGLYGVYGASDDEDSVGQLRDGRRSKPKTGPTTAREFKEEEDDTPEADLEDYLRVQSRAFVIQQNLNEPFFEEAIKGTFIRLLIGNNPSTGKKTFRMCEVEEVVPYKKSYKLRPWKGKQASTDRVLKVSIGNHAREAKIIHVSESRLQPEELADYITALRDARCKVPTKRDIERRRAAQLKAQAHVYSHDEIQAMVNKRYAIANPARETVTDLLDRLGKAEIKAREAKDLEKLELIQKELRKLEREQKASQAANEREFRSQVDINRKAKQANLMRDIEAGQRERRAELAEKRRIAEGGVKSSKIDVFSRRETRPTQLWVTSAKSEAMKKKQAAEEKAALESAAEEERKKKEQKAKGKVDNKFWIPDREVDAGIHLGKLSTSQICDNVRDRIGINPLDFKLSSLKERRYAKTISAAMGAPGSKMRDTMRNGVSLGVYLQGYVNEGN
jgi:hypothetical protein